MKTRKNSREIETRKPEILLRKINKIFKLKKRRNMSFKQDIISF